MNTKIYTDMEGFRSIKKDWERLEQQDSDVTYYSTFHFNYSWWLTFGENRGNKLFIICCYRDNKLTGIAPLMIKHIDKKVTKLDALCFMGRGDYLTFLLDKKDPNVLKTLKALFTAIEDHSDQWDRVELTHLAEDTSLLYYLFRHDKYNAGVDYLTSCPQLDLGQYSTFEEFKQIGLYPRARKSVEKFQREVSYQFKVIISSDNDRLYDRISHIHKLEKDFLRLQKNRLDRKSIFDDKLNEEFLKRIFHDNEQLVTFLLEDEEGEIIIYRTCYLYKDTIHGWNTGYSPRYAHYHSLSDVLMIEMIQYMYEHQFGRRIDFGAGSYPWKFKWTRQFIVNYSFTQLNMSSKRMKKYRFFQKMKRALETFRGERYAR
ncbi:GNAT family N-acetyltransferase [Paenibacillus faecalis]|uniref:GNAT family N-acetyltransferase n=1 Tax=Paenibacillus faecalis TaxID=2079532 RepID=UPI000D104B76|nr:GNAT family N-acetyltransferase [Paenibacillus faecalis]